jgi:hypothetical protein
MNEAEITATPRRGRRGRGMRIVLGAAGAIALASTALGSSLASASTQSAQQAAPGPGPSVDVVGRGLVTCAVATGEIGYSPASQAGVGGPLTVSIWFDATKCTAAATRTTPVPRSVIGSMSFTMPNGCPLGGWFGQGFLNLAYNYPPVPTPVMIDPSVAPWAAVSNIGTTPYWTITGQVVSGSYPSTKFVIKFKPDVIGNQNCKTGITSEYISRAQTPDIFHI